VHWQVAGITSARRARTVTDHLLAQTGVQEAGESAGGNIRIEFDLTSTSEPALQPAQEESGEHLDVEEDHGHDHADDGHDHSGVFAEKTELIFAGISVALLILGTALSFVDAAPTWLPLSVFVAAYGFGGYYLLREAIANLRLRRLEINALLAMSAS
jgi:Cd2+/Zn2+-exporting ATPase